MSLQGKDNKSTFERIRRALGHVIGAGTMTAGGWLVIATNEAGRAVGVVAVGQPELAVHQALLAAGPWVSWMLLAGGVAWEAVWIHARRPTYHRPDSIPAVPLRRIENEDGVYRD